MLGVAGFAHFRINSLTELIRPRRVTADRPRTWQRRLTGDYVTRYRQVVSSYADPVACRPSMRPGESSQLR